MVASRRWAAIRGCERSLPGYGVHDINAALDKRLEEAVLPVCEARPYLGAVLENEATHERVVPHRHGRIGLLAGDEEWPPIHHDPVGVSGLVSVVVLRRGRAVGVVVSQCWAEAGSGKPMAVRSS
jgi:hypothetical protein